MYNMRSFQKDNYNFYMYPIQLGTLNKNYFLFLYEDGNKFETLVNIIKFNRKFNRWQCVYCETLPYTRVKFHNKKWDLTDDKVLVLYSAPMGSGGFISYEVLGVEEGKINKYVSEEYIFKGTIFFEGEQLIRGTGNQFRVWTQVDDQFELKPYRMPIYPGAFVIKYSIVDENTVDIEKTQYTLPVGSIVQFIREDFNDISERLLVSGSCTEFLKIYTFKINCKSKTTATIIPGGYNWDGAKNIIIVTQ